MLSDVWNTLASAFAQAKQAAGWPGIIIAVIILVIMLRIAMTSLGDRPNGK
jgi:hypothetical protein